MVFKTINVIDMELTGKCKKDFEKWLSDWKIDNRMGHFGFQYLHDSMQWGVYVDFFDSVNYNIGLIPHWLNNNTVDKWYFDLNDCIYKDYANTRQEARTEAIKKANEIYNSKD